MSVGFQYNDGGRKAAGFKGDTGDCVTRAIAIATGLPYADVYAAMAEGNANQRAARGSRYNHAKMRRRRDHSGERTARQGINVKRKWFRDYMAALGWKWVPTMRIGSGCTVHLSADELPPGRLIVSVSKHYTTMIDGVIHDTYDPRREVHWTRMITPEEPLKANEFTHDGVRAHHIERRCVYGYWTKGE